MRKRMRVRNNINVLLDSPAQVTKFEKEIRETTEKLISPVFIKYNFHPNWLRNPETGWLLELDIFIFVNKIAIEVQDKCHFKNKIVQKRDKIKRKLCKENGIDLIEIPYFERNPREFLENEIVKIYINRL